MIFSKKPSKLSKFAHFVWIASHSPVPLLAEGQQWGGPRRLRTPGRSPQTGSSPSARKRRRGCRLALSLNETKANTQFAGLCRSQTIDRDSALGTVRVAELALGNNGCNSTGRADGDAAARRPCQADFRLPHNLKKISLTEPRQPE